MLRFFLSMVSMMVAGTSTAGGVSQCPVDTIPIQIVTETRNDPETTLSVASISDSSPHFRAFMSDVTKHVAARLARDKLCIDNADSKKQSLLQFANWPIANWKNEHPAPAPSLEARAPGICRISSPWIDLAIGRRPVPWIRGVVRWNERQLLADQALLAGAKNVPLGVAVPLKQSDFLNFAQDYANSEIRRMPAAKPIEERVPPDLLWLFRRTSYAERAGPFVLATPHASTLAMEKGAEGYTKLVIALIDRCFDADGAEIRYNSILDAADLILLEQYKIDMPIRFPLGQHKIDMPIR